jgi:hypothetical protein
MSTTEPDPDTVEQHPGQLIDWDTFTEEMLRKIQG